MEHFKQGKYRSSFGILRIIPAVKWKWIRRARLQMGTVSWDTIAVIQDLLRVWGIVVIREEQRNQGSWLYSMEEGGSENWASTHLGLVRELRATCSGGKHFRPMPTLPLTYSSLSFWLLGEFPKMQTTPKLYEHLFFNRKQEASEFKEPKLCAFTSLFLMLFLFCAFTSSQKLRTALFKWILRTHA